MVGPSESEALRGEAPQALPVEGALSPMNCITDGVPTRSFKRVGSVEAGLLTGIRRRVNYLEDRSVVHGRMNLLKPAKTS